MRLTIHLHNVYNIILTKFLRIKLIWLAEYSHYCHLSPFIAFPIFSLLFTITHRFLFRTLYRVSPCPYYLKPYKILYQTYLQGGWFGINAPRGLTAVFRFSPSRRCILSTFSLLKLIGLLIFLYQALYCL